MTMRGSCRSKQKQCMHAHIKHVSLSSPVAKGLSDTLRVDAYRRHDNVCHQQALIVRAISSVVGQGKGKAATTTRRRENTVAILESKQGSAMPLLFKVCSRKQKVLRVSLFDFPHVEIA